MKKKFPIVFYVIGGIATLIAAYYCAGAAFPGVTLFTWYERLKDVVLKHPWKNYWNDYTVYVMLAFLMVYGIAVLWDIANKRNYMPGKEMGSAKFGDISAANKKLEDPHHSPKDPLNIVLSKTASRRIADKILCKWYALFHGRKARKKERRKT